MVEAVVGWRYISKDKAVAPWDAGGGVVRGLRGIGRRHIAFAPHEQE